MVKVVRTETETGRVLSEKIKTDNWWNTYKSWAIFDWFVTPKYPDAKTMVIEGRKGVTFTLTKMP